MKTHTKDYTQRQDGEAAIRTLCGRTIDGMDGDVDFDQHEPTCGTCAKIVLAMDIALAEIYRLSEKDKVLV